MGAQWKQAGREANAQKKGQMTAKLVRELMVAAKLGGPDPDLNPRLAAAVEKARKASVYRDTIERAIKKGSGQTDEKITFELITFEGFAPHKVRWWSNASPTTAIAPRRKSGTLFKAGPSANRAASDFFLTIWASSKPLTRPESRCRKRCDRSRGAGSRAARSRGYARRHQGARFLTEIKDLDAVSKALKAAGWNIVSSEIRYLAKTFPNLAKPRAKRSTDFLNALGRSRRRASRLRGDEMILPRPNGLERAQFPRSGIPARQSA